MIRHFVLLRFRADVSAETKSGLYEELARLRDHLPGIVDFQCGSNVSVETELIRGNHDAFWVDFADENARDEYLRDHKHQAVGARIVAHTIGGIDGVTVVDLQF
ncbi:Dabb family protein [Mesorhizobium sp. BH1-1-4]|uniref:Dabb family protein n=1 Tax=Mesorhizobium sp. BH1-1-4 TaxID=2876662 RepID=UPI001CD193EC|nr:Dabb family protein [Mesorhizobium sp. BH1-1-4]MBZ9994273.1 Dabb family protein [Mesorhizobium sp. BH1-1-4]